MKFEILERSKTIFYFEKQNKDLIDQASFFLDKSDFKNGNDHFKFQMSSSRKRIIYKHTVNGENYFFKKFVNTSFKKKVLDLFRSQRATRSIFLLSKLKQFNISTYDIKFAMINTQRLFNRPSIIVTKEYKGKSLEEILSTQLTQIAKGFVLENFIQFYVKLLKSGFYHNDPNLTNFIMEDNQIKLIDIDDIHFYGNITESKLKKNLKKLNKLLLYAMIRPKEFELHIQNFDRKYIIQEVINRFDPSLDVEKIWNSLEKKTSVKITEVTNFINSYENLKDKMTNNYDKIPQLTAIRLL